MSGNTAPQRHPAATACELFKLLRGQWLDRGEISRQLPLAPKNVALWVAEMAAHGVLIEREDPGHNGRGFAPKQFTLAPEWGGKA